jgi:hypothetical protein
VGCRKRQGTPWREVTPDTRAFREPALQLVTGQVMTLDHPPVRVGHREFEDVLCQVDGDGHSIDLGLRPAGYADTHTT